jgi:hypothetical protein
MFAPDTGATGWSMRTWLGVIAVMMISIAMCAQMPVGGTFSTVQAQPVFYGTPIVAPPIVSLGNGLTPTVITNRQPFVVGLSQYVPAEAVPPPVTNVSQITESENPEDQQTTAGGPKERRHFDFVVSKDEARSSDLSGDTRSLVEVAAATRKSRMAPAAGKAYTNDDVGRMNQKYGMRPQSNTPANPGQGTDQQVAPTQNPPSPAYANPPKR